MLIIEKCNWSSITMIERCVAFASRCGFELRWPNLTFNLTNLSFHKKKKYIIIIIKYWNLIFEHLFLLFDHCSLSILRRMLAQADQISYYFGSYTGLTTFYPTPTFSTPVRYSSLGSSENFIYASCSSHKCTPVYFQTCLCIFQVGEGVGFAYQSQTFLSLLTWLVKPANNQE